MWSSVLFHLAKTINKLISIYESDNLTSTTLKRSKILKNPKCNSIRVSTFSSWQCLYTLNLNRCLENCTYWFSPDNLLEKIWQLSPKCWYEEIHKYECKYYLTHMYLGGLDCGHLHKPPYTSRHCCISCWLNENCELILLFLLKCQTLETFTQMLLFSSLI